jgi:hypothetical protein
MVRAAVCQPLAISPPNGPAGPGHRIDVKELRIELIGEVYDSSLVDTNGSALIGGAGQVVLEVPQAMIVHIRSISGTALREPQDHR